MEFISATAKEFHGGRFINRTGTFSRSNGIQFTISFVYPTNYDSWVADNSDAWYLLGVAAAFAAGENYSHPEPVDHELLRNTKALVRQWADFYPGRRPISLSAEQRAATSPLDMSEGLTACFFTGGVDSSFSLARRSSEVDVLMKASFNFDRSSEYEFVEQAHHKFVESTSIHDKHAFVVGTNILWPFEEFSDAWTFLTHGPALTAMGHLFSKKINRVLISSTHAYGELIPWGSHPLTDPLLSSSNMAVEHVGAAFSRFDKVVTLAGYPAMLPHLSVCGLSPEKKAGAQNCSKCQKCLRTMAALDLCDVDPLVATSFDWRAYSASSLATTHLHHPNEYIFFEELASAARAAGRQDILTATSQAIRRSAKYKPLVFVENVVRRRFGAVSRMRSLKKMKQRFYSVVRR